MFATRLISGIFLVIAAIVSIVIGGNVMFAVTALISIIGLYEVYRVFKIEKELMGAVGYLFTIAYYGMLYFERKEILQELTICFLIIWMAIYVLSYPKYNSTHIMSALFGVIYVTFMMSYLYQIRCKTGGAFLVGLVFLCSWGCDTFAYVFGMLFGKHKLAPVLSPKKSVEGAIGGVAGAAALGAVYGVVLEHMNITLFSNHAAVVFAICCAVGAVISQIGDLTASAIKRNHEIKDYGNLIPGHGGILDRFDSILITAPIIYVMSSIWI